MKFLYICSGYAIFSSEIEAGVIEHNIQLEKYRLHLHELLADAVNLISEQKVCLPVSTPT